MKRAIDPRAPSGQQVIWGTDDTTGDEQVIWGTAMTAPDPR